MKCLQCSNKANKYCSQCAKAFYCSSKCQIRDWEQGHANTCLIEGEKREREDEPFVTFESFIKGKREETKQIIKLPLGRQLTRDDLPNFWLPDKALWSREEIRVNVNFGMYQSNGHTFLVNFERFDPIYYTTKEKFQNNFIVNGIAYDPTYIGGNPFLKLVSEHHEISNYSYYVSVPVKLNIGDQIQFYYPETSGGCNRGEPKHDDDDDGFPYDDPVRYTQTYICNPVYEVIALPTVDEYLGALKKPKMISETNYPTESELHELALAGKYTLLENRLKQISVKSILVDRIQKGEVLGGQLGIDKNVWYDILLHIEVRTLMGMITKIPFVTQIIYQNADKFWKEKTMLDFPELFYRYLDLTNIAILEKISTSYPWRNVYMVFRYFIKKYRTYWFSEQKKETSLYTVIYDFSKSPEEGIKTVTFKAGNFSPLKVKITFVDALKDTRTDIPSYLGVGKSIPAKMLISDKEYAVDPANFFRNLLYRLYYGQNIYILEMQIPPNSNSKKRKNIYDFLSQGYVYKIEDKPVIGNEIK